MAARSHYEQIDMVALSEGIAKECPNEVLDEAGVQAGALGHPRTAVGFLTSAP